MGIGDDVLVAKGYRPVQRDQQFLMPPSMREWLPADDPVWLVIESVASLDTAAIRAVRKTGGAGRAAYHPDMLLTLLIWGWAQGQRSSRQLERLCHRDVAYRIICGGEVPDHVTIARFRADCAPAIEDLFTQVLMLCSRVGMGRLGVVALDGVKIASNASLSANRTEQGLREALASEAARAAAEHAAADTADDDVHGDDRGDLLPRGLHDPGSRQARIAAALADLAAHTEQLTNAEAVAAQRRNERDQAAEKSQQAREEKIERARERRAAGGPATGKGSLPIEIEVEVLTESLARAIATHQAKIDHYRPGQRGRKPGPVETNYYVRRAQRALERAQQRQQQRDAAAAARPAAVCTPPTTATAAAPSREPCRNITDPQSRMMGLRGGGWLQGFNCQAVTSDDGLIIATGVGNNPADVTTFTTMLDKAVTAAALIDTHRPKPPVSPGIGVVLADAGYLSEHNLTAPGPDRLIATGKHRAVAHAAQHAPTHGPPPSEASPIQAMTHRLATPEGHALYRQRAHIAETPFAHAKHNLGFRRFTSRGLDRATAEFSFHALVHNLFKAIGTAALTPTTA